MNDQHDQLNAWADGELPPDAAARFERESGLNEARQWLAADAPGLERADELTAPRLTQLRNPKSAIRNFRWAWQMAAAASIFVGGVCIGRVSAPNRDGKVVESINTPAVSPTPGPGRSGLRPDSGPESGQRPDLPAAPQRYVRQDDGRVIIETTLADSGAHATWVIDGSFKLASNETKAH
ncbi:MAG: hypothetical protein ABFD69_13705 [Candidatus Sumerlaeia bacterium]